MDKQAKELAVVVGYIMNYSLFNGTRYSGGFFSTIDYALQVAEEFIKVYPYTYKWREEVDFEETLEVWVKNNAEQIINNKTN